MTNAEQKTETKGEEKIIRVRQEIEWHIANYFLESFRGMGILLHDTNFQKKFSELSEYVNDKISLITCGDITDTFVIVELKATDGDERAYRKRIKRNTVYFE